MKRLLFLVVFTRIVCSICAQTGEDIFEWGVDNTIVAKNKFLDLYSNDDFGDIPLYVYKEYKISSGNNDSYSVRIMGANKEMSIHGNYDLFEIYYKNKSILKHIPYGLLYDVRYITVENSKDYFVKVPLSGDSFALFFGGWLFGDGETTEMTVVVVSSGRAKVVFDDYAYSYKYTPGENFSIEFVDDINGLHYENNKVVFTENFLKSRTKYKIWREGNMLKYKSWR